MKQSIVNNALLLGTAGAAAGAALALWSRSGAMDLAHRVVLITGGSRGLGLALAREFARQGSSLVLCARDAAELSSAAQDLAHCGVDVLTVPCDVADRAQVARLIDRTIERFGRLDIVVNNAGTIQVGPVDSMTTEDFEDAMNVIFWGTVHTTLAALPQIRKQREGRIVNITSLGGKISVPHLVPYSCAKFATVAFSEGLRSELEGTGVKVVTIAPGLMRTGSYLNALFKGDQEREAGWFSVASSFPGISMSAARAARQVVAATRTGRRERVLSTPANLAARFHGLLPETTVAILGLVNRLLPKGRAGGTARGAELRTPDRPLVRALTALGRRAAREYLQPAS